MGSAQALVSHSHATGRSTQDLGSHSQATGRSTQALGSHSQAPGRSTGQRMELTRAVEHAENKQMDDDGKLKIRLKPYQNIENRLVEFLQFRDRTLFEAIHIS